MNKLFCSTGALVGRVCNYDYSLIKKHLPALFEQGYIDGMEFMMIPYYYDRVNDIIKTVNDTKIPTPVMHCEKDIGILFSECERSSANKALNLFKINCEVGKSIGAEKMVFHLWGGTKSDSHIEYNISLLPRVLDIISDYNMRLLIENIPSTTYSGLQNWGKLLDFSSDIDFIFDTRFGAFHEEIDEILSSELWEKVKHIHISDYSSFPRDFSKIRPILHPCEGVINFPKLFNELKQKNYDGSFTLESPVMLPNGCDVEKLKKSLRYIKAHIK